MGKFLAVSKILFIFNCTISKYLYKMTLKYYNNYEKDESSEVGKNESYISTCLSPLGAEAWLAVEPPNVMIELPWKLHLQDCPVCKWTRADQNLSSTRHAQYPRSEKWDTSVFFFLFTAAYLVHTIKLVNIICTRQYTRLVWYLDTDRMIYIRFELKRRNMWAGFWTSPGKRVSLTKTENCR